MTAKRAIGMIAVSSAQQVNGVSLDEQERQVRARCEREGWRLLEPLVVLPGVSRTNPDIVSIFTSTDAQYAPYRRLRQMILNKEFDVLVAFDDGRVGRSKSMFVYVAENCIANSITVCSLLSGMITEENEDIGILMGAQNATANLKRFKKMTSAALDDRVERGLSANNEPGTHRLVYDDRGKPVRLELRTELRRLLDDAATLLLEGHPWRDFGYTMYKRFGHVKADTGKLYSDIYFWYMFHNPFTFGYSARKFQRKHGNWAFDPAVPLPPGVIVNRQPNPPVPPVYEGEQLDKIISELHRRKDMSGRARPHNTSRFSGIMVCGECGRRICIVYGGHPGRNVYYYWACPVPRLNSPTLKVCTQAKYLPDDLARQQINAFFEQMVAQGAHDVAEMITTGPQPDIRGRVNTLLAEIEALNNQIDTMIIQQSQAPASVQNRYNRMIREAGQKLEILENNLAQAQAQLENTDEHYSRVQAFDEIVAEGLDNFWQNPSREINQRLRRALGKHRFVVRNAEIIDIR